MTSKKRFTDAINHIQPDKIPIDFGATAVTGMHITCVRDLRKHYKLEDKPIKLHEPFQCLGMIEDDLADIIGVDVTGTGGPANLFGVDNTKWKSWRTPWGQDVLTAEGMVFTKGEDNSIYTYPQGDINAPPSGRMPEGGWFFDAVIRQQPLSSDDPPISANLEEFTLISEDILEYMEMDIKQKADKNKGIISSIGGSGLGDIALVPAMQLKNPEGIRDVTEWYISTITRRDYVYELFNQQTDIAIQNMKKVNDRMGDLIDVVFLCGTDFGTQRGTFCSPTAFKELYMPHYKKMSAWIHANTDWKVFKHTCGAIASFLPLFIESGFDIINPVQLSAEGMDAKSLKREFGRDLTFWGAGVDTQRTLPFGTPLEVRSEVIERCEILSPDGGFIFNAIHNVQANTPIENIAAMIDAVKEFNG